MAIIFEYPQGPRGKPVVVIAVEHDCGVITHASLAEQRFEMCSIERSAHNLVLQFLLPVKPYCTGDMPLVVRLGVDIDFNESHIGIVKVSLHPVRIDKHIRVFIPLFL